MKITCKNCGHSFEGAYCNECGQKSRTQKINFQYMLSELSNGILQVDKGIFFTIKELFTRPGHSIRAYLEGKRINHYRPIAFLLLTSTIYALLAYFFGLETVLSEAIRGAVGGMTDGDHDFVGSSSTMIKGLNWLASHPAQLALLLFPLFSVASSLAFRKSGYNYFEHLVLNAYLTGQQALVYMFFVPITYWVGENYWVGGAQILFPILLTFWTYTQFFKKKSSFSRILLTILTYLLYIGMLLLIINLAIFVSLNMVGK